MSKTMKKVEEYKTKLLLELLDKITPEQKNFFFKLFPNGVPSDKIETAYGLIERTIDKNEKTSSARVVE